MHADVIEVRLANRPIRGHLVQMWPGNAFGF